MDKIKIFLGLEAEMHSFPELDTEGYDYLIGSCHFFEIEGEKVSCDRRAEVIKEVIDTYFGGDIYALIEAYYERVGQIVQLTGANIIGHFDLITKFQEQTPLVDETHPRYIAAWKKAVDAILPHCQLFEINTGAVSSGLRELHPLTDIIKRYKELGGEIITIGSDAHKPENICGYFNRAEEVLKECGFKYYTIFEKRVPEFKKL